MKIRTLLLLLILLPICATAQLRFGYVRYTEICLQMPQYADAQQYLKNLQAKYEQEAQRSETEFQRKFSEFLQGQKDFPANILQKRQAELQDVMERGISFRKEAEQLLRKAEQEMMQDVYNQLNAAIAAVGTEMGYAFVLNVDDNAAPFINPSMGDDVTDYVRYKLGILKDRPMINAASHTPVPEQPQNVAPAENAESPVPADGTAPVPTEGNPTTPTEGSSSVPATEDTKPTTPTVDSNVDANYISDAAN